MVIGGGGREHALCWKLSQSPVVDRLFCAPGNPGIAQLAHCVPATDFADLRRIAHDERVDLVVVGPEVPLAAGIVDDFTRNGLNIFGPTRQAAQLESSKVFAKEFMQRHAIPTADYRVFHDLTAADDYIMHQQLPLVIKVDGLAAGKGVFIVRDRSSAKATLASINSAALSQKPGQRIIVEQFMEGEELSCIAVVARDKFVMLTAAQDHKQIGDGDTGPNTGGMGAYSPVPIWTPEMANRVRELIIKPTVEGMVNDGIPFTGFLYAGLMIVNGNPVVLEYNVRMGDPEAQVLLYRLRTDLALLIQQATKGQLEPTPLDWDHRAGVCVVLATNGYPGVVTSGAPIRGLDAIAKCSDIIAFHAGTAQNGDTLVTAGGRVLGITALGDSLEIARNRAYMAANKITWEGIYYRRDIGHRALHHFTSKRTTNTEATQ